MVMYIAVCTPVFCCVECLGKFCTVGNHCSISPHLVAMHVWQPVAQLATAGALTLEREGSIPSWGSGFSPLISCDTDFQTGCHVLFALS